MRNRWSAGHQPFAFAVILWSLAASASAQQPADDASRFVGSWELVSIHTRWPDGRVTPRWGAHPAGRLTYDAGGRMVALLMHEGRNQANGQAAAAEVLAECAGYFGTYRVDTKKRVVYHEVAGSIRASEAGTLERAYELRGDELTLTANVTRDGVAAQSVLLWRRLAETAAR